MLYIISCFTIYSIINGVGHMWFLPMLFCCFAIGWILIRWNIADRYKLLLLLALSALSFVSLPLRIGSAMYYLFFFYAGVCLQKHSHRIEIRKRLVIVGYWALFAAVFVLSQKIIVLDTTIIEKTIRFEVANILRIIYAALGLWALYITSRRYVHDRELSNISMKLSSCCFGVYIFQQFVLQAVYYKTAIPILVGPFVLPWAGVVAALSVSLIAGYAIYKNRT